MNIIGLKKWEIYVAWILAMLFAIKAIKDGVWIAGLILVGVWLLHNLLWRIMWEIHDLREEIKRKV